eukprot:403376291
MPLNVCVECGTRHECNSEADKFLEYERNLKILNIILCFSNIYRHIFFNHETIYNLKKLCAFFSGLLFVMLYWHEVRNFYINQEDFIVDYFSPQIGRKNIQLVYTFNPSIIVKVLLNNFSYMMSLVVLTYTFKKIQFMRRSQQKTSSNQLNFELFMRVLYVIQISHIGYLGIFMEIIWNYNPIFYVVIEWYNIYSNFICISAILNNKFEKFIAIFMIYMSILISHTLGSLFISSNLHRQNNFFEIYNFKYNANYTQPISP